MQKFHNQFFSNLQNSFDHQMNVVFQQLLWAYFLEMMENTYQRFYTLMKYQIRISLSKRPLISFKHIFWLFASLFKIFLFSMQVLKLFWISCWLNKDCKQQLEVSYTSIIPWIKVWVKEIDWNFAWYHKSVFSEIQNQAWGQNDSFKMRYCMSL